MPRLTRPVPEQIGQSILDMIVPIAGMEQPPLDADKTFAGIGKVGEGRAGEVKVTAFDKGASVGDDNGDMMAVC